jgi:hypothetical protein
LIFQPNNGEAGTLGMVLTSDGTDRWALTCLHVLARPDLTLVPTDQVLQPDASGGVIAVLRDARMDGEFDAIGVPLMVAASDEVLGIGQLAAAREPEEGMRVIKSGWKTGVTEGRILRVTGDEVIIEPLPGFPSNYLLATGGDSGAVWVDAATRSPVARHKAESGAGAHVAFASALPAVLTSLSLRQI